MRTATAEQLRGDCLASATVRASLGTACCSGGAARRSPASTGRVFGRNTGGDRSRLTGDASPHEAAKQHHAATTTVTTPIRLQLRRILESPARIQLPPIIEPPAFAVLSEAQGEIASQAAK